MSCATGLGGVAGERAGGAAELVVERDSRGERGEAHRHAYEQVVQGAGAVAFETEDVFGGPEDRFDSLADRREVRAAALLVFAAGAPDLGVKRGEGGFALDAADGL